MDRIEFVSLFFANIPEYLAFMRLFLTAIVILLPHSSLANGWVEESALARKVLGQLQVGSALENVEYCGYIGFDASGTLVASDPVPGGRDWCDPVWPEHLDVVASYHTHADYDPTTWAEIPSPRDMETDEEAGIDGYVSTPGGRFWYIDSSEMIARQICGIGCLPRAPRFRPAPQDDIGESYSYHELIEKTEGQ